jgi:hypothetical protein
LPVWQPAVNGAVTDRTIEKKEKKERDKEDEED